MDQKNRKTATLNMYCFLNNKNMARDCPGSKYERTKDISIMILEENKDSEQDYYLRDITYLSLDDAYKKYIIDNCETYPEPYTHMSVVHPHILKNRILSQIKYRNLKISEGYDKYKDECFLKYCYDSISDDERVYLENTMYFDDIIYNLSSDFGLREKATEIISKSSPGSWLVRRSSVREQEHVKIRVITCRFQDEISNYLIGHINGFGYVLTNGIQGSDMPSLGDNKTIKIHVSFYSLPDLLEYMKLQGIIKLDEMINQK